MSRRFTLIHACEPLPADISGHHHNGTIMLAGALPRAGKPNQEPAEWRADAYPILDRLGFDGIVITPERRQGADTDYTDQVGWEQDALFTAADVKFFYLTRTEYVLALSTNAEGGETFHFGPGQVVVCVPEDSSLALNVRYMEALARRHGIEVLVGLEAGLRRAVELIGEGAERHGGACQVPLAVWRTPSFQQWFTALEAAGNRLDGFRLETTLRPVPNFVLYWTAKVDIWVAAEERHKSNEWVTCRPDISHIVLVHRDRRGPQLVYIQEFRSTVRNPSGLVHEFAGGSSAKPHLDPIEVGIQEVFQETGLRLTRDQLTVIGSRQAAATMLPTHVFGLVGELTDEQYAWALQHEGEIAGNAGETERTRLAVTSGSSFFLDPVTAANFDLVQTGLAAAGLLLVDERHRPSYTVRPHAGTQYVVVAAEALTTSALSTVLGMMATGTTLVLAGPHRPGRGFERRVNLPDTLVNFAQRFDEHGLTANIIHLPDQAALEGFFGEHHRSTSVFGFVGDYGISPVVAEVAALARRHGIPVIGSWCGSTPEPELVLVNGSLAAPDDGYVPFAKGWAESARCEQLATTDAVVVSIGRITPAAYYELTRLMIGGTRIIYGGAPIGVAAPAGRIHITGTLNLMAAKLGVAQVPAHFTYLEERDAEQRRLELLAMAQRLNAPLLAFADDQGLRPGVVQECQWASQAGIPVIGLWAGSGSALELRITERDGLDLGPDALTALAKIQATSLSLAGRGSLSPRPARSFRHFI